MGPPASHRITRVPWYSGTGYLTLVFAYRAVTSSGCAFQHTSANLCDRHCRPATPKTRRFSVWAIPISLAATLGIDVSFSSSGYLDVSVHRVPSVTLCIHVTVMAHYRHRVSPIRISMDISLVCSSPWLFAAYHVLLRLLVPRHPPYALISLIVFLSFSLEYRLS